MMVLESNDGRMTVNARRRWPSILAGRATVVLAVVLASMLTAVAVAGCGSSSSSTTATSAAGPGETKTYTDPDYGYSFAYPASWQIHQQTKVDVSAGAAAAGGVGVFDPAGAKAGSTYIDLMLVSVYKLTLTVDDSNLTQLQTEIEAVLKSVESQDASMKVQDALSQTTAAGMNGYEATYTFDKDGTPCTTTLYFLFDGKTEYQLSTQAATENWEADQPIFDAMIASFKPGPAQ
jgi:hypothetical protein